MNKPKLYGHEHADVYYPDNIHIWTNGGYSVDFFRDQNGNTKYLILREPGKRIQRAALNRWTAYAASKFAEIDTGNAIGGAHAAYG